MRQIVGTDQGKDLFNIAFLFFDNRTEDGIRNKVLFPYSEILACEEALHWGISPEVTRARDTRGDEEAQYGVLVRLASPDTQNRELASRLLNTC